MTPFRAALERLRYESSTAARDELVDAFEPLSGDQLDVVGWVIERLAIGNERYGPLDLASDQRDFARERNEEIADALVYQACLALSQGEIGATS
jgi:hypothetical protein